MKVEIGVRMVNKQNSQNGLEMKETERARHCEGLAPKQSSMLGISRFLDCFEQVLAMTYLSITS
ncbi:hypothetical protein D0T87_10870 [Bacteroides sp. 51]|nr:hypothetical protein [Bacteroides sp. 51]